KVVKRPAGEKNNTGWDMFDHHTLASAGPDGKFDTRDDLTYRPVNQWEIAQVWWLPEGSRHARHTHLAWRGMSNTRRLLREEIEFERIRPLRATVAGAVPARGAGMPPPPMAAPAMKDGAK